MKSLATQLQVLGKSGYYGLSLEGSLKPFFVAVPSQLICLYLCVHVTSICGLHWVSYCGAGPGEVNLR